MARSRLLVEQLLAPDGGENSDTTPRRIAQNQATGLRNFLADGFGRVIHRGGLINAFSTSLAATIRMASTTRGTDFIGLNYRDETITGYDYPKSLFNAAAAIANLNKGKVFGVVSPTEFELGQSGFGTVATRARWHHVGYGAITLPGPYTYGPAYDTLDDTGPGTAAADATTTRFGPIRRPPMIRVTGAYSAFTEMTNHPRGACDITYYLGRAWLAMGTIKVGAASIRAGDTQFNAVIFSNPVTSTTDPLPNAEATWLDPVTQSMNYITLGQESGADNLVGFGRLANQLVCFKRNSIWQIVGSTPPSFQGRQISASMGCLDKRSIVELDNNTIFFLSQQGFMIWDGVQFLPAGDGIKDTFEFNCFTVERNISGHIIAELIDRDHILVSAILDTPGVTPTATSYIYNWRRRTWTQFDVTNKVRALAYVQGHALIMDNVHSVVDAVNVTKPLLGSEQGRDAKSGGFNAYNGSWSSRQVRLGTPTAKANIHRVIIEYTGRRSDGTSVRSNVFSVNLLDAHSQVLATWNLPGQPGDSSESETYTLRWEQDVFVEVDDIQITVQSTTTSTETYVAQSLHGIYVEYEPGREYHA